LIKQSHIALIALVTLIVAAVFAFDITPWVRGGFGWRWEYAPVPFERVLPLLVSLIVYISGGYLLLIRTHRPLYALLWGIIGTIVLSLGAAHAREGDALYFLFTRTASNVASAEWWAGAQIDWQSGQWRDWTGVMETLGAQTSNMATSPPGMPMLYGLTTDLLNRFPDLSNGIYQTLLPYQCHNFALLNFTPAEWASSSLGILTPLWAGLAVFPMYLITRRLSPEVDARIPVLWWALVPGVLLFATSSSTLFPLIALSVFYFLLWGLDPSLKGRRDLKDAEGFEASSTRPYTLRWVFIAGLIYGIGLFLNFIFLPLAALYGFYTLLHTYQHRLSMVRPILVGLWFGMGAALPWLIFFALTGQTPLQILIQSLNTHLDLERPYLYWVWMHLWDWAVWTGLALVLLFVNKGLWTRGLSPLSKQPLLPLALLLTLLALTLSGTTRGESGRIWLLLSPFALIAAVLPLSPNPSPSSGEGLKTTDGNGLLARHVLPPNHQNFFFITVSQGVFTLALAATLAPYNAPDLSRPPQPPQISVSRPVEAVFQTGDEGSYRLIGWDASANDNAITLSLRWQGVERPNEPQWFSVVLVDPDGATYPVEAWQPGGDMPYPTTCWSPDAVVGDTVTLPLPQNAPSGDWYISLAAFGGGTLSEERLTVTLPDGSEDAQIGLGPVVVP
jgi:hypothetical protein